jgi:hypothetical protein
MPMIYRRYPLIHRRLLRPGPRYATKPSSNGLSKEKSKENKKTEKIPLPNEPDKPGHVLSPGYSSQTGTGETNKSKGLRPFPFLNNLHKKIQFEDIIILGLIFLLLNEEIRDDILLIVLIYILLT